MTGPSSVHQLAAETVRVLERRFTPQTSPRLAHPRTINFLIDGGGSAITAGVKGFLGVDDAFYITGVELLADASGSVVVDIARASYTNFPTFTSLVASAAPTLSAAQKYQDNTLTGWTRTLSPDDVLRFQVTGTPATVQLVLVKLRVRPGN